jgi:formylglycine-generating enzyme
VTRIATVLVFLLAACSEVQTPSPSAGGGGMGGAGGIIPECQEAPGVWPMVAVPDSLGGHFCIDSREATNEQYAAFLASGLRPTLHPACSEVADYTPMDLWPPQADSMGYPVVAITWCQAQAFCLANGKRLCGEEGTGLVREYKDGMFPWDWEEAGEMYLACSHGGTQSYAYGNELEPGRCNDNTGMALPSGSESSCEGGYPGIFFLQGNVHEWEGACNFEMGENAFQSCSMRGIVVDGSGCGSSGSPFLHGEGVNDWSPFLGVRCCADTVR